MTSRAAAAAHGSGGAGETVAPADCQSRALSLPAHVQRYHSLDHGLLRAAAEQRGYKNSFLGSTEVALKATLELDDDPHLRPPLAVFNQESRSTTIHDDYHSEVLQTTLVDLANCLPDSDWETFKRQGWVTFDLELTGEELRMINTSSRTALAEMGVIPSRRDTFAAAENVLGYDPTHGWYRNPQLTASQFYVATHPRMYRFFVGFHARWLIRQGYISSEENVRACLELVMQSYNSKLKLPGGKESGFCHTDCNWKRPTLDLPAPQCAVFTSPSHVEGQEIFRWRFVDIDTPEARAKTRAEMEAKGEKPGPPYEVGVLPKDKATRVPDWAAAAFDNGTCSTLGPVDPGTALLMGHLTAHEITQPEVALSKSQAAGDASIDVRCTRTGEYPMLVAKNLFGRVNQSTEEVMSMFFRTLCLLYLL